MPVFLLQSSMKRVDVEQKNERETQNERKGGKCTESVQNVSQNVKT